MKKETIEIRYLTGNIPTLTYVDGKSDWIDLYVAKDMYIKQGDFALVPLGVAMRIPEGYEAHLVPRSSTFLRYGLLQTNSMGVIDESYSGDNDEWKMPVYATKDVFLHVGDRICQFRIMKNQPLLEFQTVKHLDSTDRGGFGSTGK